jgi:carboxymethylenebutenolidase
MASLERQRTQADLDLAADRLRELGAARVGVVGFCMGGLLAYRSAVASPCFDAAVGFYGARIAAELAEPRCPTLLLFGTDDEYIPVSDVDAVVAHHRDTVVYPGVGHGFMRDGSDSFDEAAAADAWVRTTGFLARHLHGFPGPGQD